MIKNFKKDHFAVIREDKLDKFTDSLGIKSIQYIASFVLDEIAKSEDEGKPALETLNILKVFMSELQKAETSADIGKDVSNRIKYQENIMLANKSVVKIMKSLEKKILTKYPEIRKQAESKKLKESKKSYKSLKLLYTIERFASLQKKLIQKFREKHPDRYSEVENVLVSLEYISTNIIGQVYRMVDEKE